jgi:hypothetical protein
MSEPEPEVVVQLRAVSLALYAISFALMLSCAIIALTITRHGKRVLYGTCIAGLPPEEWVAECEHLNPEQATLRPIRR